jgi:FeS assembly SUF system protein
MGIRDRIKNKARKALRKATGTPEPTSNDSIKSWAPYTPNGPEGHEAMDEAPEVVGFSDTAELPDKPESTGEVPEHLVKALAEVEASDEVVKVDMDRLSVLEGEAGEIQTRIVDALRTIFDPEIPVNIYDLGLIYDVRVAEDGAVDIDMSLTSPNCPAAQSLPVEVKEKAEGTEGTTTAEVAVIWEPPWGPEMMSEEAKLELNV